MKEHGRTPERLVGFGAEYQHLTREKRKAQLRNKPPREILPKRERLIPPNAPKRQRKIDAANER